MSLQLCYIKSSILLHFGPGIDLTRERLFGVLRTLSIFLKMEFNSPAN